MDVDPLCNRGQIHKSSVVILMCKAILVKTLSSFVLQEIVLKEKD